MHVKKPIRFVLAYHFVGHRCQVKITTKQIIRWFLYCIKNFQRTKGTFQLYGEMLDQ